MTEMLDFVKVLSNPDRLRIIGLLSQRAVTLAEIASRFNLSHREIVDHLADLEQIGVVFRVNELYSMNDSRLAALAREKLAQERPAFVPAQDLDPKTKKILKTFLNSDGSIKQIPAQPKLQIILEYLVQAFEPNTNFTEKEVNSILRRFHEDTAGFRRALVDAGFLARESDGSRYWRIK